MQYGGYIVDASIIPGNTIMFSAYLSIEGMRRGLGMKLGYSVYDHMPDNITFIDKINIKNLQEERMESRDERGETRNEWRETSEDK